MSGASAFRPDFQRMLADADSGRFDIILCEAQDRLGRRLADIAGLYDYLTFRGIRLFTTNLGEITQMHVGIMGTLAQMQLQDLGQKTRRGLLGRVRAGRSGGGLPYGYEVVPRPQGAKEGGERRIKPAEATVVRRIFAAYAIGKSPRAIARDLNEAGIPGPDGATWIDSTIRGQVERGTGILNNTLYAGRLTWNRTSYIKDPRTGKRVARINAPDKWEQVEVPHLRIVDQDLWDKVRSRQEAIKFTISRDEAGNALNRAHRREFLLSGLLACGCCGGLYVINGKDRYGCSVRRGKGTCDNAQSIIRQRIETRVLGALKDRPLAPELVERFTRDLADELAVASREAAGARDRLEVELAGVERRLQGVLRAIEDGAWRTRLNELEGRQTALKAELEASKAAPPVPQMHPNAAGIYRDQVARLEGALNDPENRLEASEALRGLISRVVLTPDADAPDGMRAELEGDLAEILALGDRATRKGGASTGGSSGGPGQTKRPGTFVLGHGAGGQLSVVAGGEDLNL